MKPHQFLGILILLALHVKLSISSEEKTNLQYLNDWPTSFFRKDIVRTLYHGRLNFDSYIQNAMTSIQLVMGIDLDNHRYDNEAQLNNAFVKNYHWRGGGDRRSICQHRLRELIIRSYKLFENVTTFSNSKDLALIEMLDSFGSPEPRMMKGNLVWIGAYEQCQSLKLEMEADQEKPMVDTRYCIVGYKWLKWSPEKMIKLGVCIPDDCDDVSLIGNEEVLDELIKLTKLNQAPFKQYQLTRIFCLPDENSPLRSLSLSAKLFILTIIIWLIIVLYHSVRYEVLSFSKTTELKPDKWSKIFAFRYVYNQLFCIQSYKASATIESSHRNPLQNHDHKLHTSSKSITPSLSYATETFTKTTSSTTTRLEIPKSLSVDLSVIDGIKVISMMWLISAHTLLFFIRNTRNGSDFWTILKDARFMTVMGGIFPVDTFFTITGILTGYLKFKKMDGKDLTVVRVWLKNFFIRYFRFLPMYLLIFWYIRDVSEYIGRGPMWDYGTANTSIKALCKQESFISPLLFQANMKPIEEHCVKPAWYLANDLQYLVITPIFMALILISTRVGYFFIGLSIIGSLIMQFITVFYSSDIDDFEVLINFKPMFGTYVLKNLWQLYVFPYNRLAPYLVGLLTGHLMYNCYQEAIRTKETNEKVAKPTKSCPSREDLIQVNRIQRAQSSQLSRYLCTSVWKPLLTLIGIVYLPLVCEFLTHHGLAAKLGTSSIIGLMRLLWSIAIGRLVYVCSTSSLKSYEDHERSFVKSFLSSPKWKPWSKIGLSALLIQWEVIGYLAQTQPDIPTLTITFLLGTILLCVSCTYLLATLLYILFEYPLSQIEQHHLRLAVFGKE